MSVSYRSDRKKWQWRFFRWGKIYSGLSTSKEQAIDAEQEAKQQVAQNERKDLSHIYKTVGVPTFQGRMSDFVYPCVYMVIRWKEVIYIGQSSLGILRPLDTRRHHASPEFRDTDSVLVWRCCSVESALKLESELIREFRPRLNIAGVPGRRVFQKTGGGRFAGSVIPLQSELK